MPLVRSASAVTPSTGADDVTATFGATPASGNVLVARLMVRVADPVTLPAGWTAAVTNLFGTSEPQLIIATKVAGASEPTGVTASWGTTRAAGLRIEEWSDIDTATPVRAVAEADAGGSTSSQTTGTTDATPQSGDVALAQVAVRNIDSTGFSWTNALVAGQRLEGLNGTNPGLLECASKTLDAAGAVESTASWGGASRPAIGAMVVLAADTSLASADAGPDQTVAAGAVVTLDASASTTDSGAAVIDGDGTWTQEAGTAVTLSSTTAVQPTFTGSSPETQVTRTFRYTVDGESDTVDVTEQAVSTPDAPSAPTATPSTVTVGDVVTFSATFDPSATAYEWEAGTGVTLSSTTVASPTWDTTGATAQTYSQAARARQQVDGTWSAFSSWVAVEVVGAGEPIGPVVTPTVVQAAPAGTAAVLISFDVEHADGTDLTATEAANAARAGTFSAPTPLWGAPGDLVARWQVSDDGVNWVTVDSGVTPGALGIVDGEDRRWTPGRVRYVRARVETTATGAPSAWSEPVAVTPLPTSAWVKPMDDTGADLGLDVPVKIRNDGPHVRTRQQSVRESLDGTKRSVRTAGLTMRRGAATFLVETPAERASLLAALDHTGPVLLQFFLDDSQTGEALYVKWQGDDSVARLGNFPADWREVSVGWVEVEAP